MIPRTPRVAVLLNGNAKRVNARVRDAFAHLVPEADLFFSRSMDDAAAFSRTIIEQRYGQVMLGGGDGTIAATLNALLEASDDLSSADGRHALPDIAVLRLGTGNGLGYLSGAGKPMQDAMRLLSGELPGSQVLRLVKVADSGRVSGGLVTPFGSLGYDAQVLNDHLHVVNQSRGRVSKALAKSLGGYFYALGTRTVRAELNAPRTAITVTARGRASIVDPRTDEEIPLDPNGVLFDGTARSVSFGTSPFYGFGLRALPFARRRSDRFHVRVSMASVAFLLTHLRSLWKGTLRTPDFVDFLVEGARIECDRPLPGQLAGDAIGTRASLTLDLSEHSFRLIDGTGPRH